MTAITILPRTLVRTYLHGLRLPLTTLEHMTSKSDSTGWPPSVAFELFEASVKRLLGALIRDNNLVREGALQRARIDELARAKHLEVTAEQRRREADATLDARRQSTERARANVDHQAEQREQAIEHSKADREREAEDDARRRQEAAAQSAERRDKAATARERAATRTRIAEETAALAKRSEALGAAKKVQRLDSALEAKKTVRKSR